MDPRTIPTPRDLAARTPRCATPLTAAPAGACQAPTSVVYDRARWERAVLDVPSHQSDKLVALVLAHFAGPGGLLPAGGIQHTPRLVPLTGLSSRTLRQAMRNLERDGLIWRPRIEKGTQDHTARPITLTMPPAHTRTEPPHTGQRP